jgi:hypothetical protein
MTRIDRHTSLGGELWWVWPARRGILLEGMTVRVIEAAEAAAWLRRHGYWSQAALVGGLG